MATLEEIKKLLETELSSIRANLLSIEKKFVDLKPSVDYTSAKYDEVLTQLGRLNDKNFSLTTDVKSLKHDLSTTQKSANESQTYVTLDRNLMLKHAHDTLARHAWRAVDQGYAHIKLKKTKTDTLAFVLVKLTL